MIVPQGSHVHFDTTGDEDYTAVVTGPADYEATVRQKQALDTGRVGFYTLVVTDGALRSRTVTLRGSMGTPPEEQDSGTSVSLGYEVR